MIDVTKAYESQYTIDLQLADMNLDGGAIGAVTTRMFFEPTASGFLGQGDPDEEGDIMSMTLIEDGEGRLSGHWKELDDEERVVASGLVHFAADPHDGELIGEWTNDHARGSWSLVKMS